MSAGERDVCRAVMDEVGDCRLRSRDLVERSLRRILCGTSVLIDGHPSGTLVAERRRAPTLLRIEEKEVRFMVKWYREYRSSRVIMRWKL